jgi:3-hydroxyisobutyrate dehydrogenase
MGLVTHVGTLSGTPLPLGEAAGRLYAEVLKLRPELGKKDFSSVFTFLKEAAEKKRQIKLGDLIVA